MNRLETMEDIVEGDEGGEALIAHHHIENGVGQRVPLLEDA